MKKQDWMSEEIYKWAILEEESRVRTLARRQEGEQKALIAIKAQHPLNANGTPGPEYEARLRKALKVKEDLEKDGFKVDFITFGGVHEGHKTVSLAEAGAKWLRGYGVDATTIEESPAVFSGNDEDRLAAKKFEQGTYSQLHVVLSAGQWDRARLYFMLVGWQPEFHPVTFLDAAPNHSMVYELWGERGVPSFAKGPEEVARTTGLTTIDHLREATK